MGYLGLDQTEVEEDNMFQRLFWPGDHAGDTDTLGKQGFWICMAIAVFSLIILTIQAHPFIGVLQFAFFALGGIGVREHSVTAATLVAVAYWVNQIFGAMTGHFPGFLWIAAGVLLIANIRGTYIAARWARRGDPDDFPERMSGSFKEKFVDQMPAKVWPKGRIPFFVIAGFYMLLLMVGMIALMFGPKMGKSEPQQQGTTIEVAPPR